MKNKNVKKGFTIVELVIVIAVIAILAAVLIPTFSNIIKKAKTNADIQLVRNLNEAVAVEKAFDGLEKYPTAHDAITACVREGYIADRIVAKSSYDIAWNSTNGDFVLVDTKESKYVYPTPDDTEENTIADADKVSFFIMRAELPKDDADAAYSIYAREDWDQSITEVEVSVGFDAGDRPEIKTVNYTRLKDKDGNDISEGQNVIIRTNNFETKVVIDAPADTVNHYSFAASVLIKHIASSSYDEWGTVGRVEVEDGHVEAKDGCEIFCLMNATAAGEGRDAAVTVDNGAIVHTNMVNIRDINGKRNDDASVVKNQQTGVAIAHVNDCGAGWHSFSQLVVDEQHIYDVCTCCGYCLVSVRGKNDVEFKKTLNTIDANGAVSEEHSAPQQTFYTDTELPTKVVEGKTVVNPEGTDLEAVTYNEQPIIPPVDIDPENNTKPEIANKCSHEFIYTYIDEASHKCVCKKCGLSLNQGHAMVNNADGNGQHCTLCNYDTACAHDYKWNNIAGSNGSHTLVCSKDSSHTTTQACTFEYDGKGGDGKGHHTLVCTVCGASKIEDCDTGRTDGACSKCGYKEVVEDPYTTMLAKVEAGTAPTATPYTSSAIAYLWDTVTESNSTYIFDFSTLTGTSAMRKASTTCWVILLDDVDFSVAEKLSNLGSVKTNFDFNGHTVTLARDSSDKALCIPLTIDNAGITIKSSKPVASGKANIQAGETKLKSKMVGSTDNNAITATKLESSVVSSIIQFNKTATISDVVINSGKEIAIAGIGPSSGAVSLTLQNCTINSDGFNYTQTLTGPNSVYNSLICMLHSSTSNTSNLTLDNCNITMKNAVSAKAVVTYLDRQNSSTKGFGSLVIKDGTKITTCNSIPVFDIYETEDAAAQNVPAKQRTTHCLVLEECSFNASLNLLTGETLDSSPSYDATSPVGYESYATKRTFALKNCVASGYQLSGSANTDGYWTVTAK